MSSTIMNTISILFPNWENNKNKCSKFLLFVQSSGYQAFIKDKSINVLECANTRMWFCCRLIFDKEPIDSYNRNICTRVARNCIAVIAFLFHQILNYASQNYPCREHTFVNRNLIKFRSRHLLPIFYQLFLVAAFVATENNR
jgi:hypothetical protein